MNEITWFEGLVAFVCLALACHGIYRTWLREERDDDGPRVRVVRDEAPR